MRYVAKWNLLDEKKEFVKYSGGLIAGSQSLKLNVRNIKIREINDQDKIFLINKYNLASFNYLTTNEAVDIDLDNNGVMDEIICLSSKEYSNNANNYYNLVVVKFNDNIFEIINEQGDNANVYNIESVFNILNKSEDMIYINKSVGAQSEDPTYENIVIKYVNNNYSID